MNAFEIGTASVCPSMRIGESTFLRRSTTRSRACLPLLVSVELPEEKSTSPSAR